MQCYIHFTEPCLCTFTPLQTLNSIYVCLFISAMFLFLFCVCVCVWKQYILSCKQFYQYFPYQKNNGPSLTVMTVSFEEKTCFKRCSFDKERILSFACPGQFHACVSAFAHCIVGQEGMNVNFQVTGRVYLYRKTRQQCFDFPYPGWIVHRDFMQPPLIFRLIENL